MTRPTEPAPGVERPTVLIVDDDQDVAETYAAWLDDSYDVTTAYDGSTALEELDGTVDVMLLDRRMPGLSGAEVLSSVRGDALDVRVAIVSGVVPDVDVIDMGFDEYLVKPIDEDRLRRVVERLLLRATYTDAVEELCRLTATKAALTSRHDVDRLRDHEEYASLEARIEELEAVADRALDRFETEDYRVAFRDVP